MLHLRTWRGRGCWGGDGGGWDAAKQMGSCNCGKYSPAAEASRLTGCTCTLQSRLHRHVVWCTRVGWRAKALGRVCCASAEGRPIMRVSHAGRTVRTCDSLPLSNVRVMSAVPASVIVAVILQGS